jgi:hypothetical protein
MTRHRPQPIRPPPGPPTPSAARALLEAMTRAAAVEEAVGILRGWHHCSTAQARQHLCQHRDNPGRDTEAARLVALANATADPRTDPDWD